MRKQQHDVRMSIGWPLALALLALTACRIGGPIDEPDIVPDSGDAVPDAAVADTATSVSNPPPANDAGSAPKDAQTGDAPSTSNDAGGGGGGDGACAPPAPVTVCDPVCNTGCSGLTRCDVADTPNTGSCIGIWISGEGTSCVKTATTDPCAVNLSCVDSVCRRLCWHDSECTTAGATCCKLSVDVGGKPSGFHYCGACTP